MRSCVHRASTLSHDLRYVSYPISDHFNVIEPNAPRLGDIGVEPYEVEENLQRHFELAHKWGCVLLLDEADVFLTRRDVSFASKYLLPDNPCSSSASILS
jgi:hypothetical protein